MKFAIIYSAGFELSREDYETDSADAALKYGQGRMASKGANKVEVENDRGLKVRASPRTLKAVAQ